MPGSLQVYWSIGSSTRQSTTGEATYVEVLMEVERRNARQKGLAHREAEGKP
jgi:hypothetical protein